MQLNIIKKKKIINKNTEWPPIFGIMISSTTVWVRKFNHLQTLGFNYDFEQRCHRESI